MDIMFTVLPISRAYHKAQSFNSQSLYTPSWQLHEILRAKMTLPIFQVETWKLRKVPRLTLARISGLWLNRVSPIGVIMSELLVRGSMLNDPLENPSGIGNRDQR